MEDVCRAVVDLSDHKVAGRRLIAAIGAFEPDGGLFVVDRDGTKGGGGDGGGRDVSQAGSKSESALFAFGQGVGRYGLTGEENCCMRHACEVVGVAVWK